MAKRDPPPVIAGLVDAHCHLDMCEDVAVAIAQARAVGVEQFVHVGCSRDSWQRAREIAAKHVDVFAAIGIHPHEASTADDEGLRGVEAHAQSQDVVAIGETGLDYYYDRSPREQQRDSLARHVELARRLELPLVLHIRDAHAEAAAIVQEARPRTADPGMIHCFSGMPEAAQHWLDMGFCLSFSGIATFPKAGPIREAARLCPGDRILLETDTPYLAPVPVRGRRNTPANVAFTCAALAGVRGEAAEALARAAAANTRRLLAMPEPRS